MRITFVVTALIASLLLVSCNENEPAKVQAPVQNRSGFSGLQSAQVQYSSNVAGAQQMGAGHELNLGNGALTPSVRTQNNEPPLQVPADARWTLYCASITGPDRFGRMAQMKAYLQSNSSLKNWYVVHGELESTLFYGFYNSIEKGDRSAAKAHEDRRQIAEWVDPKTQEKPFAGCFFTPVTPPDPVSPPEWSLTNAPPRAYWSVQIAAFKDNPLRKQAAVDAVKELRSKKVEAYYYHGASISSVCIGAWPAEAIKQQDFDGGRAETNQDNAVLVTDQPLPDRYKNSKMKNDEGQKIEALSQRIEIVDQSLIATMKEYPVHAINYDVKVKMIKGADGKLHEVPPPSFLVKIPREEASVLNGGVSGFLNPNSGRNNASAAEPVQSIPGSGRLRGLDSR